MRGVEISLFRGQNLGSAYRGPRLLKQVFYLSKSGISGISRVAKHENHKKVTLKKRGCLSVNLQYFDEKGVATVKLSHATVAP